jgi:membrane peptidoglycan carboxypeptidase
VRFYGALAGDGRAPTPYLVHPDTSRDYDLGLTPDQLDGLRRSLVAVVERGTATRSRLKEFSVAGKTGTAQNPHGNDHGWFIAFAPAEKPEIVVGAIFEFGGHGSEVGPYVVRAIRRYLLGPDSAGDVPVRQRLDLPGDAPRVRRARPDSGQVPAPATDTGAPPAVEPAPPPEAPAVQPADSV